MTACTVHSLSCCILKHELVCLLLSLWELLCCKLIGTNSICAYLIWLITIFSMQIMILSTIYIYIRMYTHRLIIVVKMVFNIKLSIILLHLRTFYNSVIYFAWVLLSGRVEGPRNTHRQQTHVRWLSMLVLLSVWWSLTEGISEIELVS